MRWKYVRKLQAKYKNDSALLCEIFAFKEKIENMTHIYQETYGQGKPIVMIHGWGMHTGIWRAFAEELGQYYRVTCVDLPGHGRSGKSLSFSLEEISRALVASVDEQPCCWIGWSLGATIVLDIASRFPERAETLILLAGNPRFTRTRDPVGSPEHWPGISVRVLDSFAAQLTENAQQTLLRFLALQMHGLENQKALVKTLKSAVFECDPPDQEALLQGLKILKEADLRSVLQSFEHPVLAVLGGRDTLVPHTVALHLQRLQPNLSLNLFEKAGHVPFLTHRQELIMAISRFLEDR